MTVEFDKQDFTAIIECIDVAQKLIYDIKENFDGMTIGTIKHKIDFIAKEIDKASFRLYYKGEK